MDYDNNRFSISQAQYSPGQPSRIALTSAQESNDSGNTDSTPESPSITKTSSQKSGGIGTGTIAGIAAAIAILALLAGAYCLWRFKFKKASKPKDNTKGKAELEDNTEPKVGYSEAFNKRRASEESSNDSKKGAKHQVKEVVQTPPAAELEGGPSNRSMSTENVGRAELPSPDPFRPELESPGLDMIRSELSTPEPLSELSTSDRNLVPELTSREMPHELTSRELSHELASSNHNPIRPTSYRENSHDSDNISPQDSASIRPNLNKRKDSDDTIPTPASPVPQRPSLLLGPRRTSGRPQHNRYNSSSSLDTFQTRWDQPAPTSPGGNTSYLPPAHPLEPYGPRTNSFRTAQCSPSPLASPPLGSQPSPSLSALNSPTFPSSDQRIVDNRPPTPKLLHLSTMSGETEPLMNMSHQQGSPRSTRFAEDFTSDSQEMTGDERQSDKKGEAEPRVRTGVESLKDGTRRDGK